jgi:hypothetical protein
MNIISKILLRIMGGIMKPPKAILPKPTKVVLNPAEAAIVFRHDGVRFIYPAISSASPPQLLDTLDYLRYALERQDWLEQWKDEKAWQDAMTDLSTEDMPVPVLQVIEGGLSHDEENVRGPHASSEGEES